VVIRIGVAEAVQRANSNYQHCYRKYLPLEKDKMQPQKSILDPCYLAVVRAVGGTVLLPSHLTNQFPVQTAARPDHT